LYLPPYYSPDPDPIEEAFSKVVKALLARWSTKP
jgi:transposase